MREQAAEKSRLQASNALSLVMFYVLVFGISWLGFVPEIATYFGLSYFRSTWWQGALLLPGIGPAAAAIAGAYACPSSNADATPLARLKSSFLRPVSFPWWVVTILLSVGMMLLASLLSPHTDRQHALSAASASRVLLFSFLSLAANPMEEIGWRGFAQARLQRTYSALTSALIVGALWAVWHIPLFLLSRGPMSMSQVSFWSWVVGVIPQAILLAWLYNRSGDSLAIVSVFHVLGNIAGYVLHSSVGTVSAVRLATALIVLRTAGSELGQANRPVNRS